MKIDVEAVIHHIDLQLAAHWGASEAMDELQTYLKACLPVTEPILPVEPASPPTPPTPPTPPAPRPSSPPRAPRAPRTAALVRPGSIPALLDEALSRELPGVDVDLGQLLEKAGITGGSKAAPYKTAMSAVARYVKRGLLTKAGYGRVRLTAPWQPAGAPALTHEHRLANERVGMAS